MSSERLPSRCWWWCSALEPSGGHWDAPAAAAMAPATTPYAPPAAVVVDAVTPGAGPAYGFFAGGGPPTASTSGLATIAAAAAAAAVADGLDRPLDDAAVGMLLTNRLRVRLSALR